MMSADEEREHRLRLEEIRALLDEPRGLLINWIDSDDTGRLALYNYDFEDVLLLIFSLCEQFDLDPGGLADAIKRVQKERGHDDP